MNLAEIAPTKTNLLEFKAQYKFSQEGHSLLEQKREVLVMHLIEILSSIQTQRKKLNEMLAWCFEVYETMKMEIGEFELEKILKGVKSGIEIDVIQKSIMGVSIPTIRLKSAKDEAVKPTVSLSNTTPSYDEVIRTLATVKTLIFAVAQVEMSAWKLAYEIKKTQRRVNALENIYIPETKEIIKFIQDTLEERERETFFQMKHVKNAHEKAEVEGKK